MNASTSPPAAGLPPGSPDWLHAVVSKSSVSRAVRWRTESVDVPVTDDVAAIERLLVARLRELERSADARVTLVDWVLVAEARTLRRQRSGEVLDELTTALQRAAAREPRTAWTVSISVAPATATIAEWAAGESYTGAFVARLDAASAVRPATWSKDDLARLAGELDATPAELAGLLDGEDAAGNVWLPAVLDHVLSAHAATSGGTR